jgi:Ras family protein A
MDKVWNIPIALLTNPYWHSQWYPEVVHFCPYTPLVLVGLKSDLRNKRTCIDLLKTQGLTPVTQEQGMNVARKMGARYMECSSKEMSGVDEIFSEAINTVVANDKSNQPQQAEAGPSGQIYGGGMKKKKRSCKFL